MMVDISPVSEFPCWILNRFYSVSIMNNNLPADTTKGFNLVEGSINKELPFVETDGLLLYKEECKTPEFLNSSFFKLKLVKYAPRVGG